MRRVLSVQRDVPPLPADVLELLKFCSDYYHHPLGEVVLNSLPTRLRRARPRRPSRERRIPPPMPGRGQRRSRGAGRRAQNKARSVGFAAARRCHGMDEAETVFDHAASARRVKRR